MTGIEGINDVPRPLLARVTVGAARLDSDGNCCGLESAGRNHLILAALGTEVADFSCEQRSQPDDRLPALTRASKWLWHFHMSLQGAFAR